MKIFLFPSIFFILNIISRLSLAAKIENHSDLIHSIKEKKFFSKEEVLYAMLTTYREDYCCEGEKEMALVDSPQRIGYGATISAPHMHALALEILLPCLKRAKSVLDVGSGSGYMTAIMAKVAHKDAKVFGIDHIPELVNISIANIMKNNEDLIQSGKIKILEMDGRQGFPAKAPYDCINVGAAVDIVPKALSEQLKVGGLMVIPLRSRFHGQELVMVTKDSKGKLDYRSAHPVSFVPLTSKEIQLNREKSEL